MCWRKVRLLCSWYTLTFLFVHFFLLFPGFLYVLYVSHKLNFIMLSSPLSCNSYSLFTLTFLNKQTRHGRNKMPFYFFFFISGRAKCFFARAVCGLTHVTVAALCFSCSLLCISNSDWATENEAGRSESVNGNEEPHWRELSPIQFRCNCNYSLITHKTPVHSTLGIIESVCGLPDSLS